MTALALNPNNEVRPLKFGINPQGQKVPLRVDINGNLLVVYGA